MFPLSNDVLHMLLRRLVSEIVAVTVDLKAFKFPLKAMLKNPDFSSRDHNLDATKPI